MKKNGSFKEMKNYHFFKTNDKKPNERLKIVQTNLKKIYGFLLYAQILQKIKKTFFYRINVFFQTMFFMKEHFFKQTFVKTIVL